MQVELDSAVAAEKMLQAQTKRLRDELKRVQRRQADLEDQLGGLQSRATEIELSNKSSEEALKAVCTPNPPVLPGPSPSLCPPPSCFVLMAMRVPLPLPLSCRHTSGVLLHWCPC
jgi:hypothetical protein